jgi:hypothetical protein
VTGNGTAGVAILPMYDFAELTEAHERLWAAVAEALAADGVPAPPLLTADAVVGLRDAWLDPDLFLSQSCGWPLVTELAGRVTVVGAFHY